MAVAERRPAADPATPLSRAWLSGLRSGRPEPRLAADLGEPEGGGLAAAVADLLADPPFASPDERWLHACLLGARPLHAVRSLGAVASAYRAASGDVLDLGSVPSLPTLLGASNFAARLLQRRPHWAAELSGALPEAPRTTPEKVHSWDDLRLFKYQGLLRISARDLLGRRFEESLRELSDLADGALGGALELACGEVGFEAPALLALGKLGGRELNFSSDVDLLFLYEAGEGSADLERNREVARVVTALKTGLEARDADGFGYRVDLDLRPEGPPGALANSVGGALRYYESFGAEWERQALLRLRHVAGPESVSREFMREIEPFVYRRAVDPRALKAVRDMKLRIEAERRSAGRELAREIKEGPGGIRDVEFLTQALQLFYGGSETSLRGGTVPETLCNLGEIGLLPEATAEVLKRCYLWLRRAEHALQLEEERQVHRFPDDPEKQRQLARRMGYHEPEAEDARVALLDDWAAARAEIRAQFEAVLPEDPLRDA